MDVPPDAVTAPLAPESFTLIAWYSPFEDNDIVICDNVNVHVGGGVVVGVAVSVGVGVAVAVAVGVGVGVAVDVGVDSGVGEADGVGVGEVPGDGIGEDDGDAPGKAPGSGLPSGIGFPPLPIKVVCGTEPSLKNRVSKVTSPDPVTPTNTLLRPFVNVKNSSPAVRPRQLNRIVFGSLVNVMPVSRLNVRVATAPV